MAMSLPHVVTKLLSYLLLLTHAAKAYDVGCLYPEAMPDPWDAHLIIQNAVAFQGGVMEHAETPILVYGAVMSSLCEVSCMASHDAKVLNPLTMTRPLLVAPEEFGHNPFSMELCFLACIAPYFSGYPIFSYHTENWGLEDLPLTFRPDILQLAGAGDVIGLAGLVSDEDYHPFTVGQLLALEIFQWLEQSGWNWQGALIFDEATGTVVNCTSNCASYADVTGYVPRNTPGRPFNESTKYTVAGEDMYWQPLLEHDGGGYFSRQMHVVPHVGVTAVPLASPDLRERSLDPPNYDYFEEALKVVEELKTTASSEERKAQIKFYDDKLWVRYLYEVTAEQRLPDQHSFQMHMLLAHAGAVADYDAIVSSWTEKMRHDLVRPTTVIQRWGSDELEAYNGNPSSTEAQLIAARDFQAFIRVMPHSEFPSGSACICSGYQEVSDGFTEHFYGTKLTDMKVGKGEFGINCKGEYVPGGPKLYCDHEPFEIADMMDLRNQCGDSRLWGGMHFSKSVPAAYELCAGLGDAALERIKLILNNSTFGGKPHYVGDPRPICPSSDAVSKNGNETTASTLESAATRAISWAFALSFLPVFLLNSY